MAATTLHRTLRPASSRTHALFGLARTALIASAILAACGGSAFAQLTDEDLAKLRKRGEKEGWTFTVGHSEVSSYSLDRLCGSVTPSEWPADMKIDTTPASKALPSAFDWRDYDCCPPIRNQGGCGSCWAFAAMGVVESVLQLFHGVSTDLSEQWLVSCTTAGNCAQGGHASGAYRHMHCGNYQGIDACGQNGAVLESDFPYVAWDAPCNGCPYPRPYRITSWSIVSTLRDIPPVSRIKQAIMDHGPVSVSVYANSAFHGYDSGVFNACEDQPNNHAVVLVGWDDTQGSNGVWIMRNSWGSWWGEDGYMRIEYGCCGIGSDTFWVELDATDCNANGNPDACDINSGTSLDCQPDEVPDECELAGNDCNANIIPDECDITAATSKDCQANDVPDECELTGNDCNTDGTPDECEPDCNSNAVPDTCDISAGTSPDCNANGIADQCEPPRCSVPWNGFPRNPLPQFFQPGQLVESIDYIPYIDPGEGDGSVWANGGTATAVIEGYGCENGSENDLMLVVSVPPGEFPETGAVTSEYFRAEDGGVLPPAGQHYRLSFRIQLRRGSSPWASFNPKTDWQLSIRDAHSGETVVRMELVSTLSTRDHGIVPGHIMVYDPANPGAYIDTGVEIEPWMWYCRQFEVRLDVPSNTVELYYDGQLVATLARSPDALRMDYLHLQAILNGNGMTEGNDTTLGLDQFGLCITGVAESPAEVYDCNANGTLDECDFSGRITIDCDHDGTPDGCRFYGDSDLDGNVDYADYAEFHNCITSPGQAASPACADLHLDFDCDGDIDLADFRGFQAAFAP